MRIYEHRWHGQRGFAYIWTLLLIGFLGVGSLVAGELYATSMRRERERELLHIGREFRSAIGRYYESAFAGAVRQYPQSLEDLLKDPRTPGMRRYLRRIYIDPMTGRAEWGLVRQQGRIVGVHSLSDSAPIKLDNFEAPEAAFQGKRKYSEWVFIHTSSVIEVNK